MQYSHAIIEDAVEKFVMVPHERGDMNARPLNHGRTTFGILSDLSNNLPDTNLNSCGNYLAKCSTMLSDFPEVTVARFEYSTFMQRGMI
jgi:hypothetical protein